MVRRALRLLGFPAGAGILFGPGTRWRLVVAMVGSVTMSVLDIVGVAALVPLVQLATSTDRDTGVIGVIARLVGDPPSDQPSDAKLAVVIAVFMVTAFVLKGVLGISLRWWQLGFVARQERRTAARLLRGYLVAPYVVFTSRGLSMQVYRVGEGVSMTYGKVVVGMLSLGTESLTLLGLALLLLVASPVAAAGAIVFFGITSFFLNRQLKHRSVEVGTRLVEHALLQFKAAIHAIGGVKEIQLRRNGEYFVSDFARNKKQTAEAQRLATALGELPEVRAGDPLRRRHGADGGRGVRHRERPVGRPDARALPRGRHADAAVPGPADRGPERHQRRPAGHADDRRRPARVPRAGRAARPAR